MFVHAHGKFAIIAAQTLCKTLPQLGFCSDLGSLVVANRSGVTSCIADLLARLDSRAGSLSLGTGTRRDSKKAQQLHQQQQQQNHHHHQQVQRQQQELPLGIIALQERQRSSPMPGSIASQERQRSGSMLTGLFGRFGKSVAAAPVRVRGRGKAWASAGDFALLRHDSPVHWTFLVLALLPLPTE